MYIKRKDLEIFLQLLEKAREFKIEFEQYPTPPRVAANLLWHAAIENNDINGKVVLDLGCGSGTLALGAAYLNAREVLGVDIDFSVLQIAKENAREVDLDQRCSWICMDVRNASLREVDTTIMNPPFGMRKESISRDRFFLDTAIKLSKTVYSILPSSKKARTFFREYCEESLNAEIISRINMNFEIHRQYDFHKKNKHIIFVDLYRIERR